MQTVVLMKPMFLANGVWPRCNCVCQLQSGSIDQDLRQSWEYIKKPILL
jgi:hypothetical protein